MTRIAPATPETAHPKAAELLSGIQKKVGFIPNVLGTLGHSAPALGMYQAVNQALSGSVFSVKERELIAIAVSAVNGCEYCVSAHGAIGKGAGAADDEVQGAIRGESGDARLSAALTFAQEAVKTRGFVEDSVLAAARDAGLSDTELIELVALGVANSLTNYVVHVADVELDFPKIELNEALAS